MDRAAPFEIQGPLREEHSLFTDAGRFLAWCQSKVALKLIYFTANLRYELEGWCCWGKLDSGFFEKIN